MILIREDNFSDDVSGLIIERTGGEKKYYIEGPFIQTEIKNRNGRIYPRQMMEEEIENYTNNMIKTKRAIGELGHPATPALNHERASHLIESLTPNGNDWIGKAKVLTSLPMGGIVKGLIDEGVSFGMSTRGIGSLKTTSKGTLVENYKIATAGDCVSDPSAPDCFVNGILENVEWVYKASENEFIQQHLEDVKKDLHQNYKKLDEAKALSLFEDYLKLL